MKQVMYRIGIDVGLNSLGASAIEVDGDGIPLRILNAQSVIHDGGVDPNSQKAGDSRRKQSGIARRTRRMRRRRRSRLCRLDSLLRDFGYPVDDEKTLQGFDIWKIRAALADDFIEDADKRKQWISFACRHIARHRGWRSPYKAVQSLLAVDKPSSEQYQQLRNNAIDDIGGEYIPEDATPAQIVRDVIDYHRQYDSGPAIRLRTSAGDKSSSREGVLPTKLMQEDNAYELERIFRVQQVPGDVARKLLLAVFDAKSPKGSAAERVGTDPLDRSQRRALKASMEFQRYRIIAMLANVRIAADGETRPLSISERQKAFETLSDSSNRDSVTWTDIAKLLKVKRRDIRGVGVLPSDGEERVSARPPRNNTEERISSFAKTKKIGKDLLSWWQKHDEFSREAMIELLCNAVDIDTKRDDEAYGEAIDFIDSLDDAQLTDLDAIDLPNGRAAYSTKTLKKLTARMLSSEDDLHGARKSVFGVDDNWRPPQESIGAPLGNPSVDRVAKIVNRFLLSCQKRWGDPETVQIEHVREAFSSVPTARQNKREYDRENGKRAEYRNDVAAQLHAESQVEKVRDSDVRRWQAINRQNGECLYCGSPIAFSSCEMDHIVPRKGVGSTNTRNNLVAVCAECNRMKSNTPFAIWCLTDEAKNRGVDMDEAIRRVRMFAIDPRELKGSRVREFEQEVIRRLKQTDADDPIDNRSIESVAWMADELHRRIDWYFNSAKYGDEHATREAGLTIVRVFRGSVTAEARKASHIEGQIHFIGAHYKTRLDRRHHAVDASVIALMSPRVAQFLEVRSNLRRSQRDSGRVAPWETPWKEYPTSADPDSFVFERWLHAMKVLLQLLNDALDDDRIPVLRWQRLSLGNSIAHDGTIKPLLTKSLGSAIDADTIRRSSTPALFCALTRLPDYSEKEGLPENPNRVIKLHGKTISASETVGFFASQSAQVAVQHGSADIGSAIHHARIYRCYKTTAKGEKNISSA